MIGDDTSSAEETGKKEGAVQGLNLGPLVFKLVKTQNENDTTSPTALDVFISVLAVDTSQS